MIHGLLLSISLPLQGRCYGLCFLCSQRRFNLNPVFRLGIQASPQNDTNIQLSLPIFVSTAACMASFRSRFGRLEARSFGRLEARSDASAVRISAISLNGMNFAESDEPEGASTSEVVTLLEAKQARNYVNWFREAWPYIQGHQGSTFVIVIAAEVIDNASSLDSIVQDISLLHGLGIKLVVVPGTHREIDRLLLQRGYKPQYVGSYQITDAETLEAAMEAAGKIQLALEAKLSPGPSIPILRRHGENNRWHVGVSVASGNFLAAKRRGVVDGVDFGATGEVKRIDVAHIRERLDNNSIVILSNLGYSSSGEVLNCNTFEVATACATALQSDKLICLLDGPFLGENGRLIRFLTLHDAEQLIRKRAKQSEIAANYVQVVANAGGYVKANGLINADNTNFIENSSSHFRWLESNNDKEIGMDDECSHELKVSGELGFAIGEEGLNRTFGHLSELIAAVFVCRGGVRRVHLLNGTIEGVLLLELYTRDGVGTMVASDAYEGTRSATLHDVNRIKELLRPLEENGVLVSRTHEQLIEEVESFIVVERDGSIIACAALFPYDNEKCGEVAAFAVSPECRGHGLGDSLLDYMEKKAMKMGLKRLFLLTTRTADWFVRRGFTQCNVESIPEKRRPKINLARGSKYYMKQLRAADHVLSLGRA